MRRHRIVRLRNRAMFFVGLVVDALFAAIRVLNPRSNRR
jgi:hypothetical protein